MSVIIMGMVFSAGSVPDFGSIYDVKLRYDNKNDYGLFEEDVAKLNSITNAAPGSTALCDDTGNLYRLTKSGWYLVGSGGTASTANTVNTANTNSVNRSALRLDTAGLSNVQPAEIDLQKDLFESIEPTEDIQPADEEIEFSENSEESSDG